jgi:hypothetical protein
MKDNIFCEVCRGNKVYYSCPAQIYSDVKEFPDGVLKTIKKTERIPDGWQRIWASRCDDFKYIAPKRIDDYEVCVCGNVTDISIFQHFGVIPKIVGDDDGICDSDRVIDTTYIFLAKKNEV